MPNKKIQNLLKFWLTPVRYSNIFRKSTLLDGTAPVDVDVSNAVSNDLFTLRRHNHYDPNYLPLIFTKEKDTNLIIKDIVTPHGTIRNFVKSACLSVLDNCLAELTILGLVYQHLVNYVEPRDLVYRSLEERYNLNEANDYGEYVIDNEYTDFHKLLKDIITLKCVLKDTRDEFDIFLQTTVIDNYIEAEKRMAKDEVEFLGTVCKLRKTYDDLKSTCKKLKTENLHASNEQNRLTSTIFTTMGNNRETAYAEVALTKKWENARQEQNSIVLIRDEERYNSTISDMQKKISLENYVHEQLEQFLTEMRDSHYNEIERMMEYYDSEIEERDMEILLLKQQTDVLIANKEKLEEQYRKRRDEMENWTLYKKWKKENEIMLKLQNQAALKIQIWWRTVMVRKKLESRTKKKRKGKSKDKKPTASKTKRRR